MPARRQPSIERHGWQTAGSRVLASSATKRAPRLISTVIAAQLQPAAIALRRDIFVGESSADAQPVLQQALSEGYRGIPAEALIAGSIDEGGGAVPHVWGSSGTPT